MSNANQVRDDLNYVANTLRRHDPNAGDFPIYILWAILAPVGFAFTDFFPHYTYVYWLVAGIGGGLLSFWIGRQASLKRGIQDKELGLRHGLHWSIGGVAFVLSILPLVLGKTTWSVAAPTMILIAGLLYSLAGIHLTRGLLAPGFAMFASYVALYLLPVPYIWTLCGVIISLALFYSAFKYGRTNKTSHH